MDSSEARSFIWFHVCVQASLSGSINFLNDCLSAGFCSILKYHVMMWVDMDVSENSGTHKSSILIGFSIINHPFWGTPIFGNIHIKWAQSCSQNVTTRWKVSAASAVFVDESHKAVPFKPVSLKSMRKTGEIAAVILDERSGNLRPSHLVDHWMTSSWANQAAQKWRENSCSKHRFRECPKHWN